jgi:DNA polymerase-3 subunit gamma/tau
MRLPGELWEKSCKLPTNQVVERGAWRRIPTVSYQVFARKYRPAVFADVLGQDHVVRTLTNAIRQNRLAHAYLFVGPRGTGKTSTARIFAKALNCPGGPMVDFDSNDPVCLQIAEGTSLDVIEIDGASNNGVDEVRTLRESVSYLPMSGQFKIYYIDEVHMLTTSAFNALLKTLEEPPPHVKFIFATTEVHKILPTILSRCQRFDLRPIPTETIAAHLLHIASKESVSLDEKAAWAIAKGADGGMRDAQSMLDQLVAFCGQKIGEEDVISIFGFTSRETVASLCDAIFQKNTAAALQIIQREFSTGRDVTQLLNELIGVLRAIIVAKVDPDASNEGIPDEIWQQLLDASKNCKADRLLAVIDVFADTEGRMKWASNRRLHLELGVIKAIQTIGEARVSDIINVLAGASGFFPEQSSDVGVEKSATAEVEKESISVPPRVEQVAAPATVAETTPEPQPAGKKSKLGDFSSMDDLIEEATDLPEPPPEVHIAVAAAPAKAAVEPKRDIARPVDDFHNDPLISKAIEIFAAKFVSV